ncbi:uncharacterized protein RHOBADRAFT_56530 [Rhodotorula graminis WP1]|uniref:BZIP domain-containing protein n=1 Tax=Rhodotorula graminis (strain WP1) TaxID=578459 RepID=A0A0P9EQC2_RHOGW|nr:uncharacterized protein RHOBADRAFT_56530 [Rhodotorula graminis WP1]KPV71707.1 hypothetical protein RHOBADRAFT_56530 [Rhodotorula graminis WP1]
MQSLSPAGSPAQPAAPSRTTAKRRLSDAPAFGDYDHGYDHDDHDDGDDDQGELPAARSKRSRPGQLNGGALGADMIVHGAQHPPAQSHKALSPAEKEQRRVARMIRNRNAAQASRDRKKEHTAFLERRCFELENLLRLNGVAVPQTFAAPPPIVAPATSGSSSSASSASHQQHVKGAPPRSQRAFSVLSDDNQGRIADLEDDDDQLRAQLDHEQRETAQLRARLDDADAKLARLAHFAPDAPFSSPFSGTTTPLPVGFEPTFAFDTPNLCPLPQPEERAYVEERERQRRLASAGPTSTSTTSTPKTTSTTLRRTSVSPSSTSPSSSSTTTAGAPKAEAVPDPVSSGPSIPSPGVTSASAATSSSSSSSSSSYAVSLVDGDIASTPPANESYLELDDRVDVSPVWSDWAKGAKLPPLPPLDGGANGLELCDDGADELMKPVFHHDGAEESALAFLDLSFLQDGPVTASC